MTFLERARELVLKMTLKERMEQMRYDAPAIPRLGVPAYNWWNECLHGVARSGAATVFPQAIGMAASFNTPLLHRVATAISDEARAKYNEYRTFGDTLIYQGLTYWSPNINIFRDPRWGRGHETYGEDPCLTGRMGTAFIKGLQGEGKYRKLDATIKHFAIHSGPEGSRHSFDVSVSEHDLRETYLWAFRYCIENADPSAIMGAYNRIDGVPCCANERLLGDILYGEWGYRGYMVSDCGAIRDIHEGHHYTSDAAESAALAVRAGCHLNCGKAYLWLSEAYERGLIDEETITSAVTKLFEARFRLGMFDNDCEYDAIPYDVVECPEHTALNRQMATESMVLLKNDGILPLRDDLTLAVIGPNAQNDRVLIGNYNGTATRSTTLLEGILEASRGRVYYALGSNLHKKAGAWEEHPLREALLAVRRADAVILCLGLDPTMEGEQNDLYSGSNSGDKFDVALPEVQRELLEAVVAEGKPTVLVNVSGSCVGLEYADRHCNAVLQCFYPGAEGGHALADVLFGRVSPSGRLPVTFYRDTEDLPPFEDYSMENRTYKFYRGTPVYRFGHGLTYGRVREEWQDALVCKVTNEGGMDTAYSVLRYEHIPYPSLVDFQKVFLRVGESVTVRFAPQE